MYEQTNYAKGIIFGKMVISVTEGNKRGRQR